MTPSHHTLLWPHTWTEIGTTTDDGEKGLGVVGLDCGAAVIDDLQWRQRQDAVT